MPACISPQSFEADEVVEMTLEEWDRILAVNLTGVFLHHSREAVRAMIPNKSGAIVNIGFPDSSSLHNGGFSKTQ